MRFEQSGHYVVQSAGAAAAGRVVAEVAAAGAGAEVALPEGAYQVVMTHDDYALEGGAQVHDGDVVTISAARMRRSDYARLVRKGGAVTSGYDLVLSAGMHTAPFGLQGVSPEAVYTSSWSQRKLGPAVALGLRRDSRHFTLEARLGYGSDQTVNDAELEIDTQLFAAELAGLAAWDLGQVTLNAGAALGALALRQQTGPTTNFIPYSSQGLRHSLALPGQFGTTWSLGPSLGPVLQVNARLWRRVFAQLDGRLPVALMNVRSSQDRSAWQWSPLLEVTLGIGCYL